MRVQRHQYAETGQQSDHRRAAVADQRQRHPDHRQYAAHHAGIDENIDKEAERDGAARQARKGILALHREVQRTSDDDAVQNQEHETWQQAELLADDRKDEIGRALRQKLELRLTAVHITLAEQPALADGDLRLDDVVAGAERVVFGLQEGEYALPLVVVNEMPGRHGGAPQQGYRNQNDPQLQPGKQHHDEAGCRDQQGG